MRKIAALVMLMMFSEAVYATTLHCLSEHEDEHEHEELYLEIDSENEKITDLIYVYDFGKGRYAGSPFKGYFTDDYVVYGSGYRKINRYTLDMIMGVRKRGRCEVIEKNLSHIKKQLDLNDLEHKSKRKI